MDCYCDFDEPWKVYSVTMRTARKVHVCRECHGRIQPCERYEHVVGIADGVETYKTCGHCIDLREFVKAHIPCFCWYHETMVSDAIEAAQHWSHEGPGLLFGAYRRQIKIERAAKASRQHSA